MATFRLQEITTLGQRADHGRQASKLVPAAGASFKKRTLVIVNGSRQAATLTNAAVAGLALAQEANPDAYNVEAGVAMGFTGANNKAGAFVESILGQRVRISAGGAAFAAGTHINASRGIKKDGTTGLSYIDLTDNATPAFIVRRLITEPMLDPATGAWVMPADGDTNVMVEAEIISTAGWADNA